jgi:glycosyltransferase involved in cell wall biosynthesis
MASVVIAAHNEENVIGDTLQALLSQRISDPFEVIVSANGCSDRTAEVATRAGAIVVDRPEPGKASALNAGEQVAATYPRIFLDADIVVPPDGLAEILRRLESDQQVLAVVPRRHLQTRGRPWPVKAYCAINERLPVFQNGLFGRGVIALSREGRSRFETFPDMIADDLFLDSLYSDDEKAEASGVVISVEAPYTTRNLLRRLVRVRRGNAEMRAAAAAGALPVRVRSEEKWAWLTTVVAREPRLLPAAVPYVILTVVAALLARQGRGGATSWGRDLSTRSVPAKNARAEAS